MAEITELKPVPEQKPLEPITLQEDRILQLTNFIDQIDHSCNKAFSLLPIELKEDLWDEDQMGTYRYAVDQLAAAEILINFRSRLEAK